MRKLPQSIITKDAKLTALLNGILAVIRAITPRTSPSVRVKESANGTTLEVIAQGGLGFSRWHLKEVRDEYLVCHSWDGENEGTDDVKIAKPSKLRSSVDTETIDGTDVDYSAYDATAQTRHASAGTGADKKDEDQIIVPRYLVDDVIFAIRVDSLAADEGGVAIMALDLNIDGRAWAATE